MHHSQLNLITTKLFKIWLERFIIVVKLSPRPELDLRNKKMAIKKHQSCDDVNLHKLSAAARLGTCLLHCLHRRTKVQRLIYCFMDM